MLRLILRHFGRERRVRQVCDMDVKLICEGASCQRASLRKWDGRAIVDVPAK